MAAPTVPTGWNWLTTTTLYDMVANANTGLDKYERKAGIDSLGRIVAFAEPSPTDTLAPLYSIDNGVTWIGMDSNLALGDTLNDYDPTDPADNNALIEVIDDYVFIMFTETTDNQKVAVWQWSKYGMWQFMATGVANVGGGGELHGDMIVGKDSVDGKYYGCVLNLDATLEVNHFVYDPSAETMSVGTSTSLHSTATFLNGTTLVTANSTNSRLLDNPKTDTIFAVNGSTNGVTVAEIAWNGTTFAEVGTEVTTTSGFAAGTYYHPYVHYDGGEWWLFMRSSATSDWELYKSDQTSADLKDGVTSWTLKWSSKNETEITNPDLNGDTTTVVWDGTNNKAYIYIWDNTDVEGYEIVYDLVAETTSITDTNWGAISYSSNSWNLAPMQGRSGGLGIMTGMQTALNESYVAFKELKAVTTETFWPGTAATTPNAFKFAQATDAQRGGWVRTAQLSTGDVVTARTQSVQDMTAKGPSNENTWLWYHHQFGQTGFPLDVALANWAINDGPGFTSLAVDSNDVVFVAYNETYDSHVRLSAISIDTATMAATEEATIAMWNGANSSTAHIVAFDHPDQATYAGQTMILATGIRDNSTPQGYMATYRYDPAGPTITQIGTTEVNPVGVDSHNMFYISGHSIVISDTPGSDTPASATAPQVVVMTPSAAATDEMVWALYTWNDGTETWDKSSEYTTTTTWTQIAQSWYNMSAIMLPSGDVMVSQYKDATQGLEVHILDVSAGTNSAANPAAKANANGGVLLYNGTNVELWAFVSAVTGFHRNEYVEGVGWSGWEAAILTDFLGAASLDHDWFYNSRGHLPPGGFMWSHDRAAAVQDIGMFFAFESLSTLTITDPTLTLTNTFYVDDFAHILSDPALSDSDTFYIDVLEQLLVISDPVLTSSNIMFVDVLDATRYVTDPSLVDADTLNVDALGRETNFNPYWRWRFVRQDGGLYCIPVKSAQAWAGAEVVSSDFRFGWDAAEYIQTAAAAAWASDSGSPAATLKAAIDTALGSFGIKDMEGNVLT